MGRSCSRVSCKSRVPPSWDLSTAQQRYWASPALHEITSGHKKGAPQRNQGRAGGRLFFRMVSGKNVPLGHKTEAFDGVLWHKLGGEYILNGRNSQSPLSRDGSGFSQMSNHLVPIASPRSRVESGRGTRVREGYTRPGRAQPGTSGQLGLLPGSPLEPETGRREAFTHLPRYRDLA